MMYYMSEGRAIYEDEHHGQFSKRLAEWAISKMRKEDESTGMLKKITPRKIEDVMEALETNKIDLPEEYRYTAFYLFNMAIADYAKSLKTDEQRALFVEETLCDPDGEAENVLDCFAVKMRNANVTIDWERFV